MDVLTTLAQYHIWVTDQLLAALGPVSDDDYRRDCGLFFGSIHGTLNHLLLAERLWFARFRGESFAIAGLDQELEPERAALAEAYRQQAGAWQGWIDQKSAALEQPFTYTNTQGRPMTGVYSQLLAHIFNHGTHHRGQITAAMTHMGYPGPALDLLYFLNPAA